MANSEPFSPDPLMQYMPDGEIHAFPDYDDVIPDQSLHEDIPLLQQMPVQPEWVVSLFGPPEVYVNSPELPGLYYPAGGGEAQDNFQYFIHLFRIRVSSNNDLFALKRLLADANNRLRYLYQRPCPMTNLARTMYFKEIHLLKQDIKELNNKIRSKKEYVGMVQHIYRTKIEALLNIKNPTINERRILAQLQALQIWEENWKRGVYDNKMQAMMAIQHLEFQREQRIMQLHHSQYRLAYNTTLYQMLNNQLPTYLPVPDYDEIDDG